ncbi:Hybrid sensor histidine kinase/response regulator [Beijerinckiaceae bacterium RH CH11]|nr:hybrid sensor histidine kinase/response regulator [Beijerinckiaceae bacterium]VVB46758.1 Hybrid sensor histidine kinase/response regulator [Beijerinckiaceae bacterium RH CH11]VVB46841.1 Hybrid sensor histidine kinase/response regulator [Beijerinckiaceae bacterium RH AL8]
MDDLLNDFLTETSEHLEAASSKLVQFEIDPSNSAIVASIFRLVHTIKGTCGFLGLSRLEALTHAAEAVVGLLRDGKSATPELVTLVLAAVDRVKLILGELERTNAEPPGDDEDLIAALESHLAPHEEEVLEPVAARPAIAPIVTSGAPASATQGDRQKRSETIRVDVMALERIMVLVSELVLTRNQLLELTRKQDDEAVKAPMQRLSGLTSDLQDSVMRARMQPLSRLFARLPRLIRELAVETGKKLSLVMEGGDTELDRQLIEVIRDPLTHILRNAADHGIEMPQERLALGKPETGCVRLAASHEAGYITVSISDDGRGLDLERIKTKAVARGLVSLADLEQMAPETVYRFIFVPEFSTAATVTSISGRGVGLDVVRENIETIGGSITVTSTFGKGTSFNLKIPLTLAIAPALIVETASHRFALPQQSVIEAIGFGEGSSHKVESVEGKLVLRVRDQVVPLVDLRDMFGLERVAQADIKVDDVKLAVIMRFGSGAFGIIVDSVADVQEIVVKPLGASLSHLVVFSGHTILGDGSVVLILDPVGIAKTIGLTQALELGVEHIPERFVPPREKTRLILFRSGAGALKVVPLSLISRIESAAAAAITISDGKLVMQHRGYLMPLLRVDGTPDEASSCDKPVLVLGIGGDSVGLVVDEIMDIVEHYLDIEIGSTTPGTIGSARIRDTVVEIIDISHYVRIARPDALERGVTSRFSVLLIDDRLFFRDMLAPLLTAAGYHVTTASSARDALFLLSKGATFHAIVTDTDMPEMDGYTFAREVRRDGRHADLPIIALAAHSAPIIEEAARASGMSGVVGKFDRVALLAALKARLDGRALGTHALEERIIREHAA